MEPVVERRPPCFISRVCDAVKQHTEIKEASRQPTFLYIFDTAVQSQ